MQNCKYLNPISNVPFSNSISCTDEIGEIVLCDNVMTNYAEGQPWILRVIFPTSKSSSLFYATRFGYFEFSVADFISLQFFQYLLLSPAEVWWLENSVRFWLDIKLAGRRLEAGDWSSGSGSACNFRDQETRDQPQICRLSSFLLGDGGDATARGSTLTTPSSDTKLCLPLSSFYHQVNTKIKLSKLQTTDDVVLVINSITMALGQIIITLLLVGCRWLIRVVDDQSNILCSKHLPLFFCLFFLMPLFVFNSCVRCSEVSCSR